MPSSACSVDYRYLYSFPTRRSSDLFDRPAVGGRRLPLGADGQRIYHPPRRRGSSQRRCHSRGLWFDAGHLGQTIALESGSDVGSSPRSEEHTSELQSRQYLVCRLLHAPSTTDTSTLSLHDALPIYSTDPLWADGGFLLEQTGKGFTIHRGGGGAPNVAATLEGYGSTQDTWVKP